MAMPDAESTDHHPAAQGRFTSTHWSVVLAAARTESPEAQGGVGEFIRHVLVCALPTCAGTAISSPPRPPCRPRCIRTLGTISSWWTRIEAAVPGRVRQDAAVSLVRFLRIVMLMERSQEILKHVIRDLLALFQSIPTSGAEVSSKPNARVHILPGCLRETVIRTKHAAWCTAGREGEAEIIVEEPSQHSSGRAADGREGAGRSDYRKSQRPWPYRRR